MLKTSFYIVQKDDLLTFTGNLSICFDWPFKLRGEWEVGIVYCSIQNSKAPNINGCRVFCDFVDYSYVNSVPMQVVDIIDSTINRSMKSMYVKVIRKKLFKY